MTATSLKAWQNKPGLAILGIGSGADIGDEMLLRAVARQAVAKGYTSDIVALTPEVATKAYALADHVFGMRDDLHSPVPAQQRSIIAFAVHRAPSFALSDASAAAPTGARLQSEAVQVIPNALAKA